MCVCVRVCVCDILLANSVRKSVTVEDVEDVLQYDGVNVCLRTSGKRIPPHEYK